MANTDIEAQIIELARLLLEGCITKDEFADQCILILRARNRI